MKLHLKKDYLLKSNEEILAISSSRSASSSEELPSFLLIIFSRFDDIISVFSYFETYKNYFKNKLVIIVEVKILFVVSLFSLSFLLRDGASLALVSSSESFIFTVSWEFEA